MKLLYINPPVYNRLGSPDMPMSLLYLSAVSRQYCDTKILDLIHTEGNYRDNLEKTINEYKPDLVGITCIFSGCVESALEVARLIKNMRPETLLMMGGTHPTIFAEKILKNCFDVDIIFIGEGEASIRRVLQALDSSNPDFSDIGGIAYRERNSRPVLTAYSRDGEYLSWISECSIHYNPNTEFIQNLDELPMPAYDLFRFEDYTIDTSNWYNPNGIDFSNGLVSAIITSRSCPQRCSFCSNRLVMGTKFRARSPQSVLDEIELLYDRYHVRYFDIEDDNFTLDKRRAIEICNGIVARKMKIAFEMRNGLSVKTLDEEVISAMVEAGLIRATLAIESGSDYIRNEVVGKHLGREKIYEVSNIFSKYEKVHLNAFFIMGFPEETEETLLDSIKMIKELQLDNVIMFALLPLPGTRVFDQCIRDNLFIEKYDEDTFWKNGNLFPQMRNAKFFVKPYRLSLEQLYRYHGIFNDLKREKNEEAKKRGKGLAGW